MIDNRLQHVCDHVCSCRTNYLCAIFTGVLVGRGRFADAGNDYALCFDEEWQRGRQSPGSMRCLFPAYHHGLQERLALLAVGQDSSCVRWQLDLD